MAVRAFDLTAPQSSRLSVMEPAPLRRADRRRLRQRWAVVGLVGLSAPFAAALIVLGVTH
jgi:hypothetical protein